MQIPIFIDGKEEGTLTIQRQGAATLMRAELRDVGRVVRLTVYGEKAGYLGVPAPEDGKLRLTRRLSPAAMAAFPQDPAYAAEQPMDRAENGPQSRKAGERPPETPVPARRVLWMGGKPHYF